VVKRRLPAAARRAADGDPSSGRHKGAAMASGGAWALAYREATGQSPAGGKRNTFRIESAYRQVRRPLCRHWPDNPCRPPGKRPTRVVWLGGAAAVRNSPKALKTFIPAGRRATRGPRFNAFVTVTKRRAPRAVAKKESGAGFTLPSSVKKRYLAVLEGWSPMRSHACIPTTGVSWVPRCRARLFRVFIGGDDRGSVL